MIHEFLNGLNDMYTKEMELAAIWLERPLQTSTERTVRICEGHLVTVAGGQLVDCINEPTHKVIGCTGTITSSKLSFILVDLKTNEPLTIKVK